MPFSAVGEVLDQGRPLPSPRAVGGPTHRGINRQRIVAINPQARNPIADRTRCKGGTLAPGNSPGTLDFSGSDLTMGSASAAVFEIGGTNPATDIDRVVNIDSFTLDGIWTITLYNGFSPSLNDSFDLWDATSVDNSSFTTSSDLNLPALPGGLGWDSSAFAATGVLTVIPEPGTTALGALAAVTLLRRRRRC